MQGYYAFRTHQMVLEQDECFPMVSVSFSDFSIISEHFQSSSYTSSIFRILSEHPKQIQNITNSFRILSEPFQNVCEVRTLPINRGASAICLMASNLSIYMKSNRNSNISKQNSICSSSIRRILKAFGNHTESVRKGNISKQTCGKYSV